MQQLCILLCLLPLLVACWTDGAASCWQSPPLERTASALAACLPTGASPRDAERLLSAWTRIQPGWGGAGLTDVLPGAGPELIIRYHADLDQAIWNPQGRLAVLQRSGAGWQVAWDGTVRLDQAGREGWDNWRYTVLDTADATGDGLDDLLLELVYSDGLHVGFTHIAVLTSQAAGDQAGLRVAFQADMTYLQPAASFVATGGGLALRLVAHDRAGHAILTRTYAYRDDTFALARTTIAPAYSTVSAETPDGSRWYGFDAFDGGGGMLAGSRHLGLYRVRDGQTTHIDIPGIIRALAVAPDGALVVAAGCGILRFAAGRWRTLAKPDCAHSSFRNTLFPSDLEFATDGSLWVGGIFGLAHYDGTDWTEYAINARRILVAPGGSLWAEGWDGRQGSDCCFTHLTRTGAVTYTHSADLPVPAELSQRIREELMK
jgi:hypothetical protein